MYSEILQIRSGTASLKMKFVSAGHLDVYIPKVLCVELNLKNYIGFAEAAVLYTSWRSFAGVDHTLIHDKMQPGKSAQQTPEMFMKSFAGMAGCKYG